jgi:hypothetical protein
MSKDISRRRSSVWLDSMTFRATCIPPATVEVVLSLGAVLAQGPALRSLFIPAARNAGLRPAPAST